MNESARQLANEIRNAYPEKAAEIDKAADAADANGTTISVTATVKVTLNKFDGDYSADKLPVETIVREGSL